MSRENILRVLEDENPIPLSMEQARVIEAVSPTVDLERVGNETHMTVRDLRGTHSAVIYDGEKGDTGEKGDKGDRGEKGEKGDTGAQGIQGEQGIQGVPGEKGEKGDTGEKGATGERGEKGDTGAQGAQGIPGVSPTVTVTDITGGHRITITDAEHPQGVSFDVMDGSDADAPVQDVTVNGTSVVDAQGVANVPMASPTAPGVVVSGTITVTGTTPSITALPGIRYVCGEVTTIDITLPASGIVDVVFTSGSTPAVFTVTPPTGVTVKWENGFDPAALEANTTYEINVADGVYGVVGQWT